MRSYFRSKKRLMVGVAMAVIAATQPPPSMTVQSVVSAAMTDLDAV